MSKYGEHFIKEIEIKNYKLFKDFKAKGFGRVNLIGGKNNVGKTAFMEACYLSQSENTESLFSKLLEIETHRDLVNSLLSKNERNEDIRNLIKKYIGIEIFIKGKDYYEVIREINPSGNILSENYKEWENGLIKIEINQDINVYTRFTKINFYQSTSSEFNEISYPNKYSLSELIGLLDIEFESTKYKFSLNFITPYSNSNNELESIVGDCKLKEKYDVLNSDLSDIFKIKKIDIIKNKPLVNINNEWMELSEFGQGLKSFINIVGSILLLENNIIFIDEIENGIHYTNFDKLWEIILTISKEQNVQVFATTHSKECIDSFARVAKKFEDEEIAFIELGRNKEDKVRAIVMDSQRFFRELEANNEVRGW